MLPIEYLFNKINIANIVNIFTNSKDSFATGVDK